MNNLYKLKLVTPVLTALFIVILAVTAQALPVYEDFETTATGQIPSSFYVETAEMSWRVANDDSNKAYLAHYTASSSDVHVSVGTGAELEDCKITADIKITYTSWQGRIGLALRYSGLGNYYIFYFDNTASRYIIAKSENGVETVISQSAMVTPLSINTYYQFSFEAVSNQLTGYVDGNLILRELDEQNTFPSGNYALYCYKQNTFFDNFQANEYDLLFVDLSNQNNIKLPVDVHEPIGINQSPIIDGVKQAVPSALGNQQLAQLGLVDVTAAPFFAVGDGITDDTAALQNAVNFARDNQMVCFIPEGEYLISDTIKLRHGVYLRTNKTGLLHFDNMPCSVVGSSTGQRPKIILKENSNGFSDSQNVRYMFEYVTYDITKTDNLVTIDKKGNGNNMLMNSVIKNIDFEIGSGNSGAVAIYMNSAEGSVLQDVSINAINGYAGVYGAGGNGGMWGNLRVEGGIIGILFPSWTVPGPTMAGITLVNQQSTAISAQGRGSLTIVGLKIISSSAGPLIVQKSTFAPFDNSINLIDSEILFDGVQGTVFNSPVRSLYLNNVYVYNAQQVVSGKLAGISGNWLHVREFAYGNDILFQGVQFYSPVYIDGQIQASRTFQNVIAEGNPDFIPPPPDLQSRHLWNENFPTFQSLGAVNVKNAPYNAVGDGFTDDTLAIQSAIDENEIVFLPKGYYMVTDTLRLKPNTKLIGVAQHLSVIFVRDTVGVFGDCNNPIPIVETADNVFADTVISSCRISVPLDVLNSFQGENLPLYSLKWQSGRESVYKSVMVTPLRLYGFTATSTHKKVPLANPLVQITGNGGGKWYNFFSTLGWMDLEEDMKQVLIENTKEPLFFYNFEPQHSHANETVKIKDSRHISIFGVKTEGDCVFLNMESSKHIRIFGHSGIGTGPENGSMYKITDTTDFIISNISDQVNTSARSTYANGAIRYRYDEFYPLEFDSIIIPNNERPVLFRDGNPVCGENYERIRLYKNGNPIYALDGLKGGDTIKATMYIDENDDTKKNAVLIAALYASSRLVMISAISEITSENNMTFKSISFEMPLSELDITELKVFAWKNFESINPLV